MEFPTQYPDEDGSRASEIQNKDMRILYEMLEKKLDFMLEWLQKIEVNTTRI